VELRGAMIANGCENWNANDRAAALDAMSKYERILAYDNNLGRGDLEELVRSDLTAGCMQSFSMENTFHEVFDNGQSVYVTQISVTDRDAYDECILHLNPWVQSEHNLNRGAIAAELDPIFGGWFFHPRLEEIYRKGECIRDNERYEGCLS
jgi:hypothetical protein